MIGFVNLFSAFGLSSAAGLNAYLPLLIVGLVARYTDLWHLQAPYDVLASPTILIVLAVLAAIDFLADKIAVVDHIAHTVGALVHPIAGAVLFASQSNILTDMHPVIAMGAGVVVAGGFHASRAAIRPVATATTGGIGNPVLSFLEDVVSVTLTVLAILIPLVAFLLFLVLLFVLAKGWRRVRRRVSP
jgi:uncharacterized membrane protein